ncbi:MAG: acyl carrier protein [Oscillospiraceae bacterium]|nr:acyl carrier protein [Oscillospiraceae bacterium]
MILEKIAELLAETAGCEASDITPDTKFSDLGIDSLDIVELIMNIEDEFKVEVEMDQSLVTVSDLIAKIEEQVKNA